MQEQQEFEQEIDLLEYLKVLLRYWWMIGPFALLGAFIAFSITASLPQRFRAECRFEIHENQGVKLTKDITRQFYTRDFSPLNKHVVLLKSGTLNGPIQTELMKQFPQLEEYRFDPFRISISPVKGAENEMLDIKVDSFVPEAALLYLNRLLSDYEKMRITSNSREIAVTKTALKKEEAKLDEKIDGIEQEIVDFKTVNNFIFMSTKTEFDQKYIAELLEKANQKQFELDLIKPQFKALQENPEQANEIFSQLLDVITSEKGSVYGQLSPFEVDISQWKNRQVEQHKIEAQYKILLKKYKPDHPKAKEVYDQLDVIQVEQEVIKNNILATVAGRIKTLERQARNYIEKANLIEDTFGDNAGIISKLDSLREQHQSLAELRNTINERLIALEGTNGDKYFTRMVRAPYIYGSHVWPSKSKYTVLGFMLCLFSSCAYVLLRFYSRAKLYDFARVSRENKMPCLTTVPHFPSNKMKKDPFFLNDMPKGSVLAESYRSLRLFMEKNIEGKLFMFTSFGPGDGKTATSLNTALCCSWTDKKTLIIDGDFRRTTLRQYFTEAPREGLLDYLKSDTDNLDSYIIKEAKDKLDYLPAGHSDEFVTELIDGTRMEKALLKLKELYDIIIFDTAPATRVVDTVHLSEMTDATMIVMRSGKNLAEEISAVVKRIPQEKLIGFVVNDFKSSDIKFTGEDNSGYGAAGYGYNYNYKKMSYKTQY